MGWEVIGFGNIDVDKEHMQEILDLMIGNKKEVIDRLIGDSGSDFYEVEGTSGTITFKMWGSKGIDYGRLDTIKEYCKKNKIGIDINVNEYTEAVDGYYYNSEDDKDGKDIICSGWAAFSGYEERQHR